MRSWTLIPLAAVLGLIAGSWGPREDLKILQQQVQSERTTRKASGSAGFDAFAKLTGIPDVAKRRAPVRRAATNAVAKAGEAVVTERVEKVAGPLPAEEGGRRHWNRMSTEDLKARIDEAADLWRTRVELARTQWKEKLGISSDGASAAFDAALTDMNAALRESMQALAEEIEAAGRVTPELGLRMMGDASRTMAETYDALAESLPADRRADLSDMPVFEFIDPSVAEPLVGVQDKLSDSVWMRRK